MFAKIPDSNLSRHPMPTSLPSTHPPVGKTSSCPGCVYCKQNGHHISACTKRGRRSTTASTTRPLHVATPVLIGLLGASSQALPAAIPAISLLFDSQILQVATCLQQLMSHSFDVALSTNQGAHSSTWFLDSGATQHMTFDGSLLTATTPHAATRRKGGKRHKLPPGPKKRPVIGNLHQVGSLPHRSLWLLSQKHGPLMHLQLGCIPTLVVSSSEMAREVLKTQDLNFCTRPLLTSFTMYSYNRCDISFSPYGEYWREMRKIGILELFSVKRFESFRYIREEEVASMILSFISSSQTPVDMRKAMVSLSNNIILRIAMGKKYEKSKFHGVLEEFEAVVGSFFVSDFFPSLGWIDWLSGIKGRLEKNVKELDEFYTEVIKDHLDSEKRRSEHEDIVDVLLRLQKEGSHLTEDNIKAVLMDIFIAGSQTSATTIVWAMTELIRNPSAMRKAQEEVRVLLKLKGKVEESDLCQLQYLKSVVKEILRLHSPVPLLLPHEAMRHCEIDGYDILPNTRVYINAWAIGRDPKTWENAEEFIPERFINSPIDFKGHDFQLIPFGSGRRICPAMNTGLATVELALANMLYSFDWELPTGIRKEDIDMNDEPGLTVFKRSVLELVAVKHSELVR